MIKLNDELIKASVGGDFNLVKQLIDQGADIHINDDIVLRYAAEHHCNLEIVKYLVGKGANIHADNDQALYLAIKYNRLEIIKYLIGKGADIPKLMDIPKDVQEIAIQNNAGNIKNIKNLRSDLRERYRHLLQASGFGFFEDE
jgi:ankyrin repeat protein